MQFQFQFELEGMNENKNEKERWLPAVRGAKLTIGGCRRVNGFGRLRLLLFGM